MKKFIISSLIGVAFATTTIFTGCSDAIHEEEETQIIEESTQTAESESPERCCFTSHTNGDHIGHSCGNRAGRSNRGGRSGRGRR